MDETPYRQLFTEMLIYADEIRAFAEGCDYVVHHLERDLSTIKRKLEQPTLNLGSAALAQLDEILHWQGLLQEWKLDKKKPLQLNLSNLEGLTQFTRPVRNIFLRYWYEYLSDFLKRAPLAIEGQSSFAFLKEIATALKLEVPKPLTANQHMLWLKASPRDWRPPGAWLRREIEIDGDLSRADREQILTLHDLARLCSNTNGTIDQLLAELQPLFLSLKKLKLKEAISFYDAELCKQRCDKPYAGELPDWLSGFPNFAKKLAKISKAHRSAAEQQFQGELRQVFCGPFPWPSLKELADKARILGLSKTEQNLTQLDQLQARLLAKENPSYPDLLQLAHLFNDWIPDLQPGPDLTAILLFQKKFASTLPPKWVAFSKKRALGSALQQLLRKHYDPWLDQHLQEQILHKTVQIPFNGTHQHLRIAQDIRNMTQWEPQQVTCWFKQLAELPLTWKTYTPALFHVLRSTLLHWQRQMLAKPTDHFIELWQLMPKAFATAEFDANLHFMQALLAVNARPGDFREWFMPLIENMPSNWPILDWTQRFDKQEHSPFMHWLAQHPKLVTGDAKFTPQLVQIFAHFYSQRPQGNAPTLSSLLSTLLRHQSQVLRSWRQELCELADGRALLAAFESYRERDHQKLRNTLAQLACPEKHYLGKALLTLTWGQNSFQQELHAMILEDVDPELRQQILLFLEALGQPVARTEIPDQILEQMLPIVKAAEAFVDKIWLPWTQGLPITINEDSDNKPQTFEAEDLIRAFEQLQLKASDLPMIAYYDPELREDLELFLVEWRAIEKACPSIHPLIPMLCLKPKPAESSSFDRFDREYRKAQEHMASSKLLNALRNRSHFFYRIHFPR